MRDPNPKIDLGSIHAHGFDNRRISKHYSGRLFLESRDRSRVIAYQIEDSRAVVVSRFELRSECRDFVEKLEGAFVVSVLPFELPERQ